MLRLYSNWINCAISILTSSTTLSPNKKQSSLIESNNGNTDLEFISYSHGTGHKFDLSLKTES